MAIKQEKCEIKKIEKKEKLLWSIVLVISNQICHKKNKYLLPQLQIQELNNTFVFSWKPN